jgi:O-glycosyl hydrolase
MKGVHDAVDAPVPVIQVDYSRKFQTVIGWGAAMTDASAYLIQTKLSATQREALMQELFGREPGIGLSFVRIAMGASDFSRSHYSYDDRPAGETDSTLAHFSIGADRAHFEPDNYPGMRLSPAQRAAIIGNNMGPLFARRGVRAQIWDWDHNWDEPQSPLAVLDNAAARKYVAAVAWHCYGGDISAQTAVHDKHPDKDTYFTECSGGQWAPVWADNLKWDVSKMVIGNARGWAKGVALWNLALDENYGPHLGGCGDCRGVVTINSVTGEITRNPEYYALAHASRFVRPGAVRIESSAPNGLETVAFRNPNRGSTVLIVLNPTTSHRVFVVQAGETAFTTSLPAGAVATYIWK